MELARTAEPDSLTDAVAPLLLFGDDGVESANAAACAELRRGSRELVGAGFFEELATDSADRLTAALALPEPSRISVRRLSPSAERADDFFELRLQPLPTGETIALVLDTSETHRLDAAIAALGESTVGIDALARMSWRPFGNAARFGVPDDVALGVRVLEWIHPDELPHLLEMFNEIKKSPRRKMSELIRMRHPYIRDAWVQSRITAVNSLDDPVLRSVLVRSEEMMPLDLVDDIKQTTGLFMSISEAMPVGVVVSDAEGTVIYCNALARELLGAERDVVGRTDWLAGVSSETAPELERVLACSRRDRIRGYVVVSLDRPDGRSVWLRVDAVPQLDEHGNVFGLVATLLDVTSETQARGQLAEAQDRLWHLATHDPLTNLPNRVLLLDSIDDALKRNAAGGDSVALLYCDLDGFKPVNDAHGHAVGDTVLCIVAERLSGLVREGDVVGRFGGDEFLVLCEGFEGRAEVEGLVERLIATVRRPMEIGGEMIRVGVTVGVSYATGGTRVDQLITDADDSMYEGKAARRGTASDRRRR